MVRGRAKSWRRSDDRQTPTMGALNCDACQAERKCMASSECSHACYKWYDPKCMCGCPCRMRVIGPLLAVMRLFGGPTPHGTRRMCVLLHVHVRLYHDTRRVGPCPPIRDPCHARRLAGSLGVPRLRHACCAAPLGMYGCLDESSLIPACGVGAWVAPSRWVSTCRRAAPPLVLHVALE